MQIKDLKFYSVRYMKRDKSGTYIDKTHHESLPIHGYCVKFTWCRIFGSTTRYR